MLWTKQIFSDDKNLDKEQKDLFQKDIEALQNSGRKLGFKVKAFVDLTAGEVIKTIEECKCLTQLMVVLPLANT